MRSYIEFLSSCWRNAFVTACLRLAISSLGNDFFARSYCCWSTGDGSMCFVCVLGERCNARSCRLTLLTTIIVLCCFGNLTSVVHFVTALVFPLALIHLFSLPPLAWKPSAAKEAFWGAKGWVSWYQWFRSGIGCHGIDVVFVCVCVCVCARIVGKYGVMLLRSQREWKLYCWQNRDGWEISELLCL